MKNESQISAPTDLEKHVHAVAASLPVFASGRVAFTGVGRAAFVADPARSASGAAVGVVEAASGAKRGAESQGQIQGSVSESRKNTYEPEDKQHLPEHSVLEVQPHVGLQLVRWWRKQSEGVRVPIEASLISQRCESSPLCSVAVQTALVRSGAVRTTGGWKKKE